MIVITGTSRGLGKGLADYLLGRREEEIIGTTRATLDVSKPESARAFAASLKGRRIRALVNNAAIMRRPAEETIATNVTGTIAVTEALLPLIQDGGIIVNVSSGMGELTGYNREVRHRFLAAKSRANLDSLIEDYLAGRIARDPYSASKALLNTYTRILAIEQPRVTVVSVCPGWVKTDMGGASAPRSLQEGVDSIAWPLLHKARTGAFYRDGRELPY